MAGQKPRFNADKSCRIENNAGSKPVIAYPDDEIGTLEKPRF